jgi:hypothetical protein
MILRLFLDRVSYFVQVFVHAGLRLGSAWACRRQCRCLFAQDGDFGTSRSKGSWRTAYHFAAWAEGVLPTTGSVPRRS